MNKLVKLTNKTSFKITPIMPFHFDGTFHKPSHFEDKLSDWELGKYWQTLRIGEKIYGAKIEDQKSNVLVTIFSENKITKQEIKSVKNEVIWRFGLHEDLSEFNKLASRDKRFYPIFKKWLGMRNSSAHSLYELLIIAVLLQNATIRRTVQMTEVLLDKFGTELDFDGKKFWALWQPKEIKHITEQELRDLKIGYRAKFIKKISDNFANGIIDEEKLRNMDREDAERELKKFYGVGPETARILLFEALHHFDTFKHIAPWQGKIYSRLFYEKDSIPIDKIREDIINIYGQKYAMLAVHYIWEDVFWRRKNEHIDWLEKEIRL